MSVTATGPDGASCTVPADGSVTVGGLLALVRDGLGLPLAADAYEVIATSGGGMESALHLEPDEAELEGYGIVGAGEAVEVRVTGKEAARGTLARRGMTEENAVERLAEELRGRGYAETVDLVVTAEWAGRETAVDDEDEDDGVELDLVTLAVRSSEVGELDLSECTTLTTLGDDFLAYCSALECVRLPAGVEKIGDHMLYESGVKSVHLSDCKALTTLGVNFLARCSALECVRLPASVEKIGDCMLYESGVKSVDLSDCKALTTLGNGFLADCSALECVRLPASVEEIGNHMLFRSGVKSVDLSDCKALTTLGNAFLLFCSALECLRLPASVEEIGNHMLFRSGVKSVDLSDCKALTTLGDNFLAGCSALECVGLPPHMKEDLDRFNVPSHAKSCLR